MIHEIEPPTDCDCPSPPRANAARGLVRVAVFQPLWAVPFALFFGTMYGGHWHDYVQCYWLALTFSYCIGLGLWACRHFIVPRLVSGEPLASTRRIWIVGVCIGATCLLSSYVAAIINHLFILPGFLGSLRAVAVSGMFTLLFTALFGGISYAVVFYRHALERAGAVEKIRRELAEAELRALRTQIHPHFLFNTLNSIAALIGENPAAAEDVVTRLADVFRYALRASDHEHASLAEELDFLRSFLEIERIRLGPRLQILEQIEPGLDAARVPSLLLQPLVENAVRHGIAPRLEGGTLTLAARRERDLLVLEVGNDGPGLWDGRPSDRGYGLRSVRERLRLAGPPHALEVISAAGAGSLVRVTLPLTLPVQPDGAHTQEIRP